MPEPTPLVLDRSKHASLDLGRSPVSLDQKIVLADPLLRSLADDLLNRLKYSFAVAASGTAGSAPDDVDRIFRDFVESRRPAKREGLEKRARAQLAAATPQREATFGRYGGTEPKDYATVGFKGLSTKAGPTASDEKLTASMERVASGLLRTSLPAQIMKANGGFKVGKKDAKKLLERLAAAAKEKDIADGAKFKHLGLFIKEVACLVETDEVGADHIAMGGVMVEADGTARAIPEFTVSSDFDEGEHVLFPAPDLPANFLELPPEDLIALFDAAWNKPGKKVAEWNVRADLGWPTAYGAVIAMAEKDDGGFWKLLKELLGKIVEIVEDALGKSIGTAVGTAIGGAIGGVAGAVIGAIVGFLIGALIDWITGDNPDDIVGTANPVMWLGAATGSYYEWTGLTKQPHADTFTMDYVGDGGHYRVTAYYQLAE